MPRRRASTTDAPRGTYEGYWKEEETRFLRENYTIMSDKDIGDLLGKTPGAVARRRQFLGLLREPAKRNWTIEEVMYLQENWGSKTLRRIANHLDRTPDAVRNRAKREGLGRQISDGELLNKEQITAMMGLQCREVVDRWIDHGLRVCKTCIGAKGKGKHRTFVVTFKNLLEFLQEHPEEWDSRRVERYALGIEYDWLVKKREEDERKNPLPRGWSAHELSVLRSRVERMQPYDKIAADLDRTVTAVRSMAHKRGYCVRHIKKPCAAGV